MQKCDFLADFDVGSLGETSIVGSGLPVATGAALAGKLKRDGRVALCFFGDGASSEGTFHESLNLAAIWKLPAIFLCENNGYAITMPAEPDAIAFAQVKRGDMKFSGFVREDGILGKIHPSKTTDWATQISGWRAALEDLARAFRAGRAAVDPKTENTCDQCPITALCRIQEARA